MASPDFQAILEGLSSNMSQADIARRLYLDPSTVCRLIHGDIREPSFTTGSKILKLQAKSLNSFVSTRNR